MHRPLAASPSARRPQGWSERARRARGCHPDGVCASGGICVNRHRCGTKSQGRNPILRAETGELTALVGGNGAGKTTSLRGLSGVQPLGGGRVTFDGRTSRPGLRTVEHGGQPPRRHLPPWPDGFQDRARPRFRPIPDPEAEARGPDGPAGGTDGEPCHRDRAHGPWRHCRGAAARRGDAGPKRDLAACGFLCRAANWPTTIPAY